MKQNILDSEEKISKLDKSNVLGSIKALPLQIEDAWGKAGLIDIPAEYSKAKNIVVIGMGGSALGPSVLKSLYKKSLKIPIEVYNHYELPAYANEDTLVILSSYSGNTAEPVAASENVLSVTKKVLVITVGGELLQFANKHNIPTYKIIPTHNPSNEPRMAVGYMIASILAMFTKMSLINVETQEIRDVINGLSKTASLLNPESVNNNSAKFLAYACFQKIIVLISAEHLRGAVHVFNNQLNENAKNLTIELAIPEMNHHYLEALSFPKTTRENVLFLLFQSNDYHPQVRKRVPLTLGIVGKARYPTEIIQATAPTKLEQVFEIIQLGAYTNFYLAMLNGVDPAPIPNVNLFKSELKKIS